MKFCKDSACTTQLTPGTSTITGKIAAGDDITVPIYWEWPYETTNGDASDTSEGTAAASLSVALTITGTQVNPTSGTTTTGIDS